MRRYERSRPGELLHIDVKLGRIPDGGGDKFLGRAAGSPNKDRRNGAGCAYLTLPPGSRDKASPQTLHQVLAPGLPGRFEPGTELVGATGVGAVQFEGRPVQSLQDHLGSGPSPDPRSRGHRCL
ncbi:hypothetical protein GCM10010104_23790 [Streptomyces indiaensis]|uniref:Uncharacterized protein n=1 Tax=Streptomyces indiaensis TaxID=284033 RepID=A0ABN3DFS6_9ACTN